MKSLRIILFAILISCISCGGNDLPKDVLAKPKMMAIMWDMLRAGELVNSYIAIKDTGAHHFSSTKAIYQQIYSIHKINEEQFRTSWDYYQRHPDLMKEVLDSLSKKTMVEPKAGLPDEKKLDSIQGVKDTVPSVDSTIFSRKRAQRDSIIKHRALPEETP